MMLHRKKFTHHLWWGHGYKTSSVKWASFRISLDEERDKDEAHRLFLALPEAFSRHGIKGGLVVQEMPRETRFHMSGDWTLNKEQRALIPWLSGQRKVSCFTWNPFNGSLMVFTLSLTLSEPNYLSSKNKGKSCLSQMESAASKTKKHSFSLSAMVFCLNSVFYQATPS